MQLLRCCGPWGFNRIGAVRRAPSIRSRFSGLVYGARPRTRPTCQEVVERKAEAIGGALPELAKLDRFEKRDPSPGGPVS
jgi:hypothetical protein